MIHRYGIAPKDAALAHRVRKLVRYVDAVENELIYEVPEANAVAAKYGRDALRTALELGFASARRPAGRNWLVVEPTPGGVRWAHSDRGLP